MTQSRIDKLVEQIKENANNVSFSSLCSVCDFYFGEPRQSGSSHRVYKTPWAGNPRVNIQDKKGKAKPYQIRQVLAAIEKLKECADESNSEERS